MNFNRSLASLVGLFLLTGPVARINNVPKPFLVLHKDGKSGYINKKGKLVVPMGDRA